MATRAISFAAASAPRHGSTTFTVAPENHWSANARTPRVLLILHDPDQASIIRAALSALRIDSVWAQRGVDGLVAIRDARFDLLLVDVDLPDISGMDLVRTVQMHHHDARVMVISQCVTVSIAAEAIRLGVDCVLERPVDIEQLLTAVDGALRRAGSEPVAMRVVGPAATPTVNGTGAGATRSNGSAQSVAERWATFVLSTLDAAHDPKTIPAWARSVGVSRSVLCECCRLVHVLPRHARDFARVMRAVHLSGEKWQPENVLDLADARALRRLLSRAGFGRVVLTPTVEEYVERQQWIPNENPGLRALKLRLHQRAHEPPATECQLQ